MQIASGNEERIDEMVLRVTRVSTFTGKTHVKELLITEAQWSKWMHGALVQDAMPGLSASDREFLLTGTTQDEWDAVFGKGNADVT